MSIYLEKRQYKSALLILVLLSFFALLACTKSNPQERSLQEGVAKVERLIRHGLEKGTIYQLSMNAIAGSGGSYAGYIYANVPEGTPLPPLYSDAPEEPWSISIYENDNGEILIKGYGQDLQKPLIVRTIHKGE